MILRLPVSVGHEAGIADSAALGVDLLSEPARSMRNLLPPSDGARYRQLTLRLDAGGALALTSHEMGAAPQAAWGVDDREVELSLGAESVAQLAFALLAERLSGRPDGLEHLKALLERHDLEHRLTCWT
jgi:hypothetical protein